MKSKPHQIERLREFLDESFVCIGWPILDDFTNLTKDEIRIELADKYKDIYPSGEYKLGYAAKSSRY